MNGNKRAIWEQARARNTQRWADARQNNQAKWAAAKQAKAAMRTSGVPTQNAVPAGAQRQPESPVARGLNGQQAAGAPNMVSDIDPRHMMNKGGPVSRARRAPSAKAVAKPNMVSAGIGTPVRASTTDAVQKTAKPKKVGNLAKANAKWNKRKAQAASKTEKKLGNQLAASNKMAALARAKFSKGGKVTKARKKC